MTDTATTPRLDEHETAPILEARDIFKTYGHVHALEGANFTVYPGEVVALIGDNGAGKSTLTKIISGVIRPDSGELLFEGRPVQIASPSAAQELGIETVYQDLALAPDLDGAANVYMGRELLQVAARPQFKGKTIVAIVTDTGERYLSHPLFAEIDTPIVEKALA